MGVFASAVLRKIVYYLISCGSMISLSVFIRSVQFVILYRTKNELSVPKMAELHYNCVSTFEKLARLTPKIIL